jgi:two-component system, cell cycle response regulator
LGRCFEPVGSLSKIGENRYYRKKEHFLAFICTQKERLIMVTDILTSESEENLLLLNFTARLLTSFTNRENLLNSALECFADFAHSERVGILTPNSSGETLSFENVFAGTRVVPTRGEIALEGSPLADVLLSKSPAVYPLASASPLPLPTTAGGENSAKCLCLPMVSADLRSVGVVTIEMTENQDRSFEVMQHLRMLSTVLAVSLENATLFAQVLKDGLTGIYVRQYGEVRLTEELARIRRYPGSVAVIFLDIDYFKNINDSLGHQAGDQVLREVAQIIQACLRQDIDVACRYGGDEFIAIIPNTGPDEACEIAERIRSECQRCFSLEPFTGVPVRVSAGVAVANHLTPLSAEELFRRADRMLYRGKQTGRNRIEVWQDDEASSPGESTRPGQ